MVALILASAPTTARSQADTTVKEQRQACGDSFVKAQRLRRGSQLLAARKQLIVCAQSHCPDPIAQKCVLWHDQVREAIPTIVIVGQGIPEDEMAKARIFIDGKTLASGLDGRPVELDPGQHRIVIELATGRKAEQRITTTAGEKNQKVILRIGEPQPSPDVESGGLSPWVYVGFGVGAAGLLTGTITGALSLSLSSQLKDECLNFQCSEQQRDDYDKGYALAHVSTVSVIVGAVGAVGGLTALLLSGSSTTDENRTQVSFRPLLGFGSVGLEGRF